MPAERALLTPFRGGAPNHVGRNLWRKQILPKASIRYRDEHGERTIDFGAMQAAITAAFNDGAFDQVPFLIDPGGPKPHDKAAVRDFRGEVKAIVPTELGLDAIVETTPDGTELLKKNPRLGVSARVVERYDRADGKHYPVAVAHVLGTLDPKVTGMKPWEAVTDMAEPEVVTIDLSGATYPDEGDRKEGQVPDEKPWEPTDEEKAALKALPQTQANLDRLVAALSDDAGGGEVYDELPDYDPDAEEASLDEILAGLDDEPAEEDQRETVGAGLGGELDQRVQAQIDLANAQHAADAARIAELEQHNRETAWQHEAADFIRAGVPPKVVELAKPYAMAESSTIDLAGTGEKFDLAKGIREILSEMKGTIDMSEEHAALPQSTTDLVRDPAVDAEEAKYQVWGTQFAGGAHDQRAAMAELAAKASKS